MFFFSPFLWTFPLLFPVTVILVAIKVTLKSFRGAIVLPITPHTAYIWNSKCDKASGQDKNYFTTQWNGEIVKHIQHLPRTYLPTTYNIYAHKAKLILVSWSFLSILHILIYILCCGTHPLIISGGIFHWNFLRKHPLFIWRNI